jgi:hypothetical protein
MIKGKENVDVHYHYDFKPLLSIDCLAEILTKIVNLKKIETYIVCYIRHYTNP